MNATPYRVIVFASAPTGWVRQQPIPAQHKKTAPKNYAWAAWNPDHTVEPGRLPGSGSFWWLGLHAARAEAMRHSYSENSAEGLPLYPWMTRSEARGDAAVRGYRAVFVRNGKPEVR